MECPVLPINCAYASVFVCPPHSKSLLTWPHGTPCPSPVYPLPTSYPVAGAFAGGAAEISPFCPGSRASAMLVARQQPLAHHCNFRGWQGWIWLPFPLVFGVSSFHSLFLYHIYVIPLDSSRISALNSLLEFWITAFQKLLHIVLSSIHYFSPSIENHFNLTIHPVSSRIMTILEIY